MTLWRNYENLMTPIISGSVEVKEAIFLARLSKWCWTLESAWAKLWGTSLIILPRKIITGRIYQHSLFNTKSMTCGKYEHIFHHAQIFCYLISNVFKLKKPFRKVLVKILFLSCHVLILKFPSASLLIRKNNLLGLEMISLQQQSQVFYELHLLFLIWARAILQLECVS